MEITSGETLSICSDGLLFEHPYPHHLSVVFDELVGGLRKLAVM
jgi:hypothetical protein